MTEDENVQSLATYVLEMARYDTDTDLRDRSRFMTAMMGLAPSNEANESAEVDEDCWPSWLNTLVAYCSQRKVLLFSQ